MKLFKKNEISKVNTSKVTGGSDPGEETLTAECKLYLRNVNGSDEVYGVTIPDGDWITHC